MTDPTPDRLRDELAAPPPPDGVLDAARTAALAAFDHVHAAGDGMHAAGDDVQATGVSDLGSRRARRQGWASRIPLGAVAAAVLLVALVGVFVTQIDPDDDDMDTATAELDRDDRGESSTGAAAAEEASPDADDATTGDGAADETSSQFDAPAGRRAFVDNDALVAALRDASTGADSATDPEAPTATSQSAESEGEACDPFPAAGVDPDSVLRIEPATVAGRQVLAVVYDPDAASDGDERVAIVDESSCSLDEDRAL